jgi:hypothetical protein
MVDPVERFMGFVEKAEGCWIWKGPKSVNGYGSFQYRRTSNSAHRIAFEFLKGPIPEGLQVLHRCDNPPCVNPEHLFLGTNLDNVKDKVQKGRQRRNHCKRGHELTGDNAMANGRFRTCRACYQMRREKLLTPAARSEA